MQLAIPENAGNGGNERAAGDDVSRWVIGRLYPIADVAAALGVPRATLRHEIGAGRLVAYQPAGRNGKVLIGGGAVRDWLAAARVRASSTPAPAVSVGLPVIADRDRRLA